MARTKKVVTPSRPAAKRPRDKSLRAAREGQPVKALLRKKHRYHPGTRARLTVRRIQKSTDDVCSTSGFRRLVHDLVPDMRIAKDAFHDIRAATEAECLRILQQVRQPRPACVCVSRLSQPNTCRRVATW